ncbi:MAG TPA: T9SS type B sorting domain-containing protein [Ohtaekwangia sp.]|nr:T9SS type B sorting domain-containing protein [Ohtaekwangia sp.]
MIIRACILLALFAVPFISAGQYFSEDGRFSVTENTACAPYGNPIVISAPECDGVTTACSIDFDYADGVPNTLALVDGQSFAHVYTEPGTYIIRIQFGTTGGFDQLEMTILPNTPPDFNIYTCSGNRVQIEITDNIYADYSIDYENDGVEDATSASGMATPFHTYGDALPKTITVAPNFVNCPSTSKTVTPTGLFSPAPPTINTLRVMPDNTIELDLTTTPNFYYQLEMGINSATTFGIQQQVTDESSLTLSALNPDNNYYCFRIGSVDICDGATPVYTGSNVICSADLDLAVQDDVMQLDWTTNNVGVNSFTVLRDPGAPATLPASADDYSDTQIVCGVDYTYQLVNEYNGGIRSFSKVVSGTAISNRTPTPIDNITAQIDGASVTLTWPQDPDFVADEYTIFRVRENNTLQAGTTEDPVFTGPFNIEEPACYQISYKDICGNQSPAGVLACPIILDAALESNNAVHLEWPAYNGWANGVSAYIIEKYDASGQLHSTINNGTSLTYTDPFGGGNDEQIFRYRIVAEPSDAVLLPLPAISNAELIVRNPNLAHPTAFIPGSSINENRTFRVFGSFISTYELKIFNRWGELIFESVDPETGWDGSFKGQPMPEGTYVFQTRVVDFAGRTFEYAGTVVLLKKG